MRNRQLVAASAIVAALGLSVAACGNSNKSGGGSGSGSSGYNAALTSVVNPSSSTSGNVVLEDASGFQSADPGNTYDATDWDVSRLWARTMLAYSEKPGTASNTLVGDVATGPGQHNAANTQWTYTIRSGIKFANGDAVTAADVAYAIARSNWGHTVLKNGPTYFAGWVENTNKYAGPYAAGAKPTDLPSGITVSGDTITFKLQQPVSDFDYLMTLPQTAPFDMQTKDTGAAYANNVIATGAYEVQSYTADKQMVLVPNPNYSSSTDPNSLHKVHAAKITINLNVAQTTVDQDILHGKAQADIGGVGVDTSDQGTVLGNPTYKARSADPENGFLNYMSINTQLAPFDNVNCRVAVEYAINKSTIQSVMGGSVGTGPIASTAIPQTVEGYAPADVYATPGNQGDVSKAKTALATCKQQEGSKFNATVEVGAYSDQPKTVDAANAEVQELNAVGFQATTKGYPFDKWASTAGSYTFEQENHMAIVNAAWGPDYPSGSGFLLYMLGSAGVSMTGGSSNFSYYSSKTFDGLVNKALETSDQAARNAVYAQADAQAMKDAAIVPLQYATALDIYASNSTNVYYMAAYGMYDYASIGASS